MLTPALSWASAIMLTLPVDLEPVFTANTGPTLEHKHTTTVLKSFECDGHAAMAAAADPQVGRCPKAKLPLPTHPSPDSISPTLNLAVGLIKLRVIRIPQRVQK